MAGSVLLIVVEQPAHRALFNRYLSSGPHHLVFSSDGEDGFDRFTEVKPDLIIAHVDIPRLDGTILCQLVRQQPGGDKVPYVLLSEQFQDQSLADERVQVVGADGYLPFPFDRQLLLERIMSLLTFGRADPAVEAWRAGQRPPDLGTLPPGSRKNPTGPHAALDRVVIEAPEEASHEMIRPDSGSTAIADLHEESIAPPSTQNRALADAADTVISYVNPYQSGGDLPPSAQPQITGDVITDAKQQLGGSNEHHDAETHVELVERPRVLIDEPVHDPIRLSMDPTTPEPSPSSGVRVPKLMIPESKTQKNTPRSDPPPAAPSRKTRETKTSADPINEPPIPDRISSRSGLDELPISQTRERDGIAKQRLIEELPREATPSASEKGAKGGVVREAIAAGVRRGLDESQLGKRLVKRVRTMHRLLEEVDYYQILGVDPAADDETLKRAYFDLSLEFHPDRFFLLRSGDLKEKIYAIYRRVTEAYTVLSDERRRNAYEDGLHGSNAKRAAPEIRDRAPTELAQGANGSFHGAPTASPPAVSAPKDVTFEFDVPVKDPKAKKLIDLARAAMREGDLLSVRLHLHLAKAYDRNNRDLDAVLARVASAQRPG